jgi:steroid delta-isomerase
MIDRATIDKTIDAYLAAFSAGDKDGWVQLFAPDAWIEDPVGTPRRTGREAIGAFFDEMFTVPDSIELRPLGIRIAVDAEAAFTMQARARIGDDTFVVDIIDVMTFDPEGKITTMRAFFDPTAMRPADD